MVNDSLLIEILWFLLHFIFYVKIRKFLDAYIRGSKFCLYGSAGIHYKNSSGVVVVVTLRQVITTQSDYGAIFLKGVHGVQFYNHHNTTHNKHQQPQFFWLNVSMWKVYVAGSSPRCRVKLKYRLHGTINNKEKR